MKSVVILFAVFVAVTSAARLPEVKTKPSLAEVTPKEVKESSEEEFRQKPMNLPALMKKVEFIENEQQKAAAEEALGQEDNEDADILLSFGLEKPVKYADVKNEADSEEDEENGDDIVPISFGIVEEPIDDSDVQESYGLGQPIGVSELKKNDVEEDNDEEDNDSVVPIRVVKGDEKERDDEDVQVSFGLVEPIAFAVQNDIQENSDGDDEEDEDEKPSNVNEKIMAEIINGAIKKFAEAHGLKM